MVNTAYIYIYVYSSIFTYRLLEEENYCVQNYSRLRLRAQQVARIAIKVMNQEGIKLSAEIEGFCSRIAKLDEKFL